MFLIGLNLCFDVVVLLYLSIIVVIVDFIFVVIVIVGNLLVLFVVIFDLNCNLWCWFNYFVVNLVVVDLMMGCLGFFMFVEFYIWELLIDEVF